MSKYLGSPIDKLAGPSGAHIHARQDPVALTANDADRLRKYLARFGLDWATISQTKQSANRGLSNRKYR
jgi:hypothetical protein